MVRVLGAHLALSAPRAWSQQRLAQGQLLFDVHSGPGLESPSLVFAPLSASRVDEHLESLLVRIVEEERRSGGTPLWASCSLLMAASMVCQA